MSDPAPAIADARVVECAGRVVDAPVVAGDREVEHEGVDAGEVEVDDPANRRAVEQHVVAEQVGMDRARGQRAGGVARGPGALRAQLKTGAMLSSIAANIA